MQLNIFIKNMKLIKRAVIKQSYGKATNKLMLELFVNNIMELDKRFLVPVPSMDNIVEACNRQLKIASIKKLVS